MEVKCGNIFSYKLWFYGNKVYGPRLSRRHLVTIRYWRTCMTRWFGFRYRIHVFVQCAVFDQVQSTCIFRFSIFESTKVQIHDFWAKSRIWSTKVQVSSSIFGQNYTFLGQLKKLNHWYVFLYGTWCQNHNVVKFVGENFGAIFSRTKTILSFDW